MNKQRMASVINVLNSCKINIVLLKINCTNYRNKKVTVYIHIIKCMSLCKNKLYNLQKQESGSLD